MICIFRVYVVFLLVLLGSTSVFAEAVYSLPDAELLNTGEFRRDYGDGTYQGRSAAGSGVDFDFRMGSTGDRKIAMTDSWGISSDAGLAYDPVLDHDNSSLADYGSYQMVFTYVSGAANSEINVSLIMNTGLTGGSGYPSGDSTNDTFWQGEWVTIGLGETATVTLDFDYAWANNISDNKAPHTGGGLGWDNQDWYAINERDRYEISNIGFQIADFNGDTLDSLITVNVNAVPAPGALALLGLGSGITFMIQRRRKTRVKPAE